MQRQGGDVIEKNVAQLSAQGEDSALPYQQQMLEDPRINDREVQSEHETVSKMRA